ncbi:MAG: hypothetical protein C0617_08545 [Desulfuromonas sp.]|uniref:DUF4410 domain-containing protein n=1 Tax=Desulfuromonas sp. TaxID=892 RepID=UPI000CAA2541|nr:DUF4410 domain-containing protein [Desulfuromonas sp.]PLX84296.1 MAG: hypothetical protein C0617_08545 [Desulfuromonas sp.]
MKNFLVLAVLCAALVAAGCAPKVAAPKMASGDPAALFILTDRGITADMDEKQVQQLNQIGNYMDKQLLRLAQKSGYQANLISSRDQFTKASGEYLLSVTIKKYNPGNKAARMLIGFGAGAVSMDTHYELFGKGAEALLANDDGVGSSRDWYFVVNKLNEKTLAAVTDRLNQI